MCTLLDNVMQSAKEASEKEWKVKNIEWLMEIFFLGKWRKIVCHSHSFTFILPNCRHHISLIICANDSLISKLMLLNRIPLSNFYISNPFSGSRAYKNVYRVTSDIDFFSHRFAWGIKKFTQWDFRNCWINREAECVQKNDNNCEKVKCQKCRMN